MAMAKYKRCPEAKDDACGKLARIKKGGVTQETDYNTLYVCNSSKGCKKTQDTDCACFVLAMHVKVKDDGSQEITEELPYPAKRTNNFDGMLNLQKAAEDYPAKGKGHEKDYWIIDCRCLAVDTDGKPTKD